MLHFFRTNKKLLFDGLFDMHNHLLPAIDDGSKNIAMSLQMLEGFKELGFIGIIPTPHVFQELYPNTPATIKKAFDTLTRECSGTNTIKVTSYGAEYMVDEVFMKNLKTSTPSLLLPSRCILVEINFFGQTRMLHEAGFTLQQGNITPILAHPERYHLIKEIKDYRALKHKGFLLQLNALSLLGHYGPDVKQKALQLLKAGLYDFVATDAHHPVHLKVLKNLRLTKKQGLQWQAIREHQQAVFS